LDKLEAYWANNWMRRVALAKNSCPMAGVFFGAGATGRICSELNNVTRVIRWKMIRVEVRDELLSVGESLNLLFTVNERV